MVTTPKVQQFELVKQLQAASTGHEVRVLKQWLNLLLEEAKTALVTCAQTDFPRLQGEAQAYRKMLDQLTRPLAAGPYSKGPTL
jgi:hypothetical protein